MLFAPSNCGSSAAPAIARPHVATEGSAGSAYADAKANVRDNIKWLTASFASIAAIVVAGSSLSGIGALYLSSVRFWIALVALCVDFGWVFFASGAGVQPLGVVVLIIALGLALLGDRAARRGWLH